MADTETKKTNCETEKMILITGGTGFIGTHLCRFFAQKDKVISIDRRRRKKSQKIENVIESYFDLNDTEKLEKVLLKYRPEVIHHCAGHTRLRESFQNPQQDAADNFGSTVSLIQACLHVNMLTGYLPKQILFSSSAAVYGGQTRPPFNEKTAAKPVTPYGFAKHAAEEYLLWFSQMTKTTVTIFRYANVYGPGQECSGESGVISKFISTLKHGNSLTLYGDGSHTRDYLYVEDLVQAHSLAVQKKVQGVFTLGTHRQTSTVELAKLCAKLFALKSIHDFKPYFFAEQSASSLDSSSFSNFTGWKVRYTLEKGLKKTVHSDET
jgi:nucleoside-diphosphate-sugar epimerase